MFPFLYHQCEEKEKAAQARGDDSFWHCMGEHESDEDKERSRKILDLCHQIEQEQENEDTNMLIRLVKLRHSPPCRTVFPILSIWKSWMYDSIKT